MTYALETRAETSKTRQMLEAIGMEILRKIFGKTKIDRIRSQQIRESCGFHPINEWVERRRRIRRKWDQQVTRMDAERVFKISRDIIPLGRSYPGRPKRRWSDLIID